MYTSSMQTFKRALSFLALLSVFLAIPVNAQNRTAFAGLRNAAAYSYGTGMSAAPPPLIVGVGPVAAGTGVTITVQYGVTVLGDGTQVSPLSTTTPINIGVGTNAETVTPTAVSCTTPTVYNSCTFTVTTSNSHGTGDPISSATFGLIEAVNAAHTLGGLVAVDGAWVSAGGVTSTITSNKGWTNVTVLDWRGTSGAVSYKAASNGANMAATTVTLY